MSVVRLGCIVEGDGEVSALPVLVRRIAARIDPGLHVDVPRPVLVKRNRLARRFGDFENAISLVMRPPPPAAILVVIDADDDDPDELASGLRARLQVVRGDVISSVVVAKHEYEAWFLAAAGSLRGRRGLPADLAPPADHEAIGDAKGWLRRHMPGGRKYAETSDQAVLTDCFDMDTARARSPSFAVCYREVERLLRGVMPAAPPESAGPAIPAG